MFTYQDRPTQATQLDAARLVFRIERAAEVVNRQSIQLRAQQAIQQAQSSIQRQGQQRAHTTATTSAVTRPTPDTLQRAFAEIGALARAGAITQEQQIVLTSALLPYVRFA